MTVVWGCEKFHLYLYGTTFDIVTDHKPLVVIYSPTSTPPARIERWGLRLQPYKFRLRYSPGVNNPADVLSRLPLTNQVPLARNTAEEYVQYIAQNAAPKAIPLTEIQEATKQDPILQTLCRCITTNHWPKTDMIRPYLSVKTELTVVDNLILRGSRIVIPASLQQSTLRLAHEGHQGIVKTKQLLREKVWWPGIDQAVERLIRVCIACQAQGSSAAPQPLHMTMPSRPWQTLHADLCGPFPTGESLLVMVDTCSRWPEVHILKSTTSTVIIKHMKTTFATHGIPHEIVTDNGPQFISTEFTSYLSSCGIKHRRVTPYWPQANSEVERFNRTIEKAIRAAHLENKNWKEELDTFLLNYRSTPHCTTGQPPAVLLFGRNIRNKIPAVLPVSPTEEIPETILQRDGEKKEKMKSYADERGRASLSDIKEGDRVLLKQPSVTKLSTTYDPKPYTVEKKKGFSLLLKRPNEPQVMRNGSMVRKIPSEEETENPERSRMRENIEKQQETYTRPKRQRKARDYYGQK